MTNRIKKILAITLTIGVILPFGLNAQTVSSLSAQLQSLQSMATALQSQINNLRTTTPNYNYNYYSYGNYNYTPLQNQYLISNPYGLTGSVACPIIEQNLQYGYFDYKVGGPISELQKFLTSLNLYSGSISGYFDEATLSSVQRFQSQYGVVSTGAGYGIVGPQTREKIRAVCSIPYGGYYSPYTAGVGTGYYNPYATYYPTNTNIYGNTCPQVSLPSCTNGAFISLGLDANGCSRGYACNLVGTSNNRPNIHTFTGPSVLNLRQDGTWAFSASDPNNDQIRYSVRWGDEDFSYVSSSYVGIEFSGSKSLTHSYQRAGTFTVILTIYDDENLTTEARLLVTVYNNESNVCTSEYSPVCGQVAVQCITTPCNPIQQTFENICRLNQARATYLYSGVCSGGSGSNYNYNNIPLSCRFWSDGTNSCTRTYSGGSLSCSPNNNYSSFGAGQCYLYF